MTHAEYVRIKKLMERAEQELTTDLAYKVLVRGLRFIIARPNGAAPEPPLTDLMSSADDPCPVCGRPYWKCDH